MSCGVLEPGQSSDAESLYDGWLGWSGLGNKQPASVDYRVDVKRGAQPAGNLCRVARRSGSVIEVPANGPDPWAEREAGDSIEAEGVWTGAARMYVCLYRDEWALSLESSRVDPIQFNSSKSYLAVGRHG